MKILFLTSAFNGMAQRAWIELDRLNHQVRVQIASSPAAMEAAVAAFEPQLIIAPYLKAKIPESIWKKHVCLIVHPGIRGDRGASSLDWAILNDEREWGVTILQATGKMDAGAIWASRAFPMRPASKACIYRHEVTQAAMAALLEAVANFEKAGFHPEPLDYSRQDVKGRWNRSTASEDFRFSWQDDIESILKKARAADSSPGVPVELFDGKYFAFGAHREDGLRGKPGQVLAQRDGAICIACADAAIWFSHLREDHEGALKLPAMIALGEAGDIIPEHSMSPFAPATAASFREIRYEEEGPAGYLHFDFYNGAMSTSQCRRLRQALAEAKKRPVKVIVLMGGEDVWPNGIHLNVIEQAENPADESWANINAIDDLILEIIQSPGHYIISALQGNAGAGGVPLALAADKVLARNGIVLNPHTRTMGLYGSEYWTYLLPRRIGTEKAAQFTEQCLPWGTAVAKEIGLIDDCFEETAEAFRKQVKAITREIVALPYFDKLLMAKRFQRRKDEAFKPLAKYRDEELEQMRRNFYENDQDYDHKRFCFVHKINDPSKGQQVEERDWYSSRRKIYRRRKWESIDYEGE
ncbi:MAG: hypothetical protein KDD19_10440 [Phaeodactylibacter sp.]|nr:hypothetical protein [Phaeodactylibacter sp.]MCB9050181.1 hydrogenase maturation protein [Lewinellaceae bacterium]